MTRAASFKADALLLLTAMIWGGAFVAQRQGMDHVGPFTYTGVRFAIGALALWPLLRRSEALMPPPPGARQPDRAAYVRAGVLAGLVMFGGVSMQQLGLVTTTAGKAGFITGLYVVIVPLLGLCFGRRCPLLTLAGALLAAVGLYLLSVTEDFRIAFGDLLVLIGAVFWAVHVLAIGWLSPRLNPVKLAVAQFTVCAVLSLVAAVIFETITWAGLVGGAVPIAYGGLLSVGVAYTLQVVAQREADSTHAAILLSLEAVFAAVAGWLVLGESMGTRGLIGCALMLGGMVFSQLTHRES